mgnify:CR=1 FL=1|jgi:very-short-patch-repair endonuclease
MDRLALIYVGHTQRQRDFVMLLRQSMTLAEKTIWGFLKSKRLKGLHFRRQQIIEGFIVDFYCHAASLIIEIDGPGREGLKEQDAKRKQVLKACGLRILRFSDDRVRYDLFNVLEEILAAT